MSSEWRAHPLLRERFHPDSPDDVQVLVHDGGPRLSDRRPELVWVRVTGCEQDLFTGQVLNQPERLVTVKERSLIQFVVPTSGPAVQVSAQYLAERPEWIVNACSTCGFSELLDAPSDLIRKVFPNLKAEEVPEAFTAFCGVCGGVQVVQHWDFVFDDQDKGGRVRQLWRKLKRLLHR
jgi:hypothetical protein